MENLDRQTDRRSNFELLRVVAMFMIVINHILTHCVIVQLTDSSLIEGLNNGWYNFPVFYKRLLLLSTMNTFGETGNGIFLLISGYFVLQNGKNVNLIKISKKLLLQLGFAAILLVTGSFLVFRLTGGTHYISLVNITTFNSMSWYVGYYFAVVLIATLFLNERLLTAGQHTFMVYLVVLFATTQFTWTAGVLEGIGSWLSTLVTGIFLYSLGGYIRCYDPFQRVRTYAFPLLIGLIYILICLSTYNTTQTRIEDFYRNNPDGTFYQTVTSYGNRSIIIITIAVSMFEIFKRIQIPKVRWINFLGQSTFMIYLIHDNSFFYSLWALNDWITDLHNSALYFLVKLFVCGAATFGAGVVAYTLYLLALKLFKVTKPLFLKRE